MKTILIIWLLMSTFQSGFGQQNETVYFNYHGKNIEDFLATKVKYPKSLISVCAMPFVYVKFKINNNKIDSVTINNNNSPDLNKEILSDMALTNGYWNVQATENKWFVLPILFHLDYEYEVKGCDLKTIIDKQFIEFSNLKYIEHKDYFYFPPLLVITYLSGISKN